MPSKNSLLLLGLPKQILARLMQYGYEDISDILATSPETLVKDLSITLEEAQSLIERCGPNQAPTASLPLTQKASDMLKMPTRISTSFTALDNVLGGGLVKGHILEISGPPGSIKEKVGLQICSTFLNSGNDVLILVLLDNTFKDSMDGVHIKSTLTLQEFMLVLHQLSAILDHYPKSSTCTASQKSAMLDKVKQTLLKATTRNLTVVVTSNLSTKMLNKDGSPGSFDTGGRAVLVPALGSAYLPTGKTQRVVIYPDGPKSG
ncbi:hypothetical protein CVT24_001206 [Panaeolus cyanescens]|uniref:RecA family profile 1 domain-containing protein n=1 Tax=Panaeolus cyanescens TaxID=181874 RepID=A0A409VTW3_9AGAR|nr:hypothetical protein CVT24_001206 [Panaeolus cyanescens]